MRTDRRYSCLETCGQEQHCGNTYCSAHPRYVPPTPKNNKRAEKRRRDALHPKKKAFNFAGGGMR